MIPPFADAAFHPQLNPRALFDLSLDPRSEEVRDELQDFAADLATIRNLPEYRAVRS